MLAQGAVAATAPRGADEPFRGFDDIWAAFGKLKEALALPAAPGVGETKHADTERTVRSPASYRELDDAVPRHWPARPGTSTPHSLVENEAAIAGGIALVGGVALGSDW